MISVFAPSATAFTSNGDKILQPRSAVVRKEDNGNYYLDLTDTIDNIDYYIGGNIVAVPTPWGKQAFRMGEPKRTGRKITIRAWHVFFDSANYIIDDSYVVDNNANYALDHLNNATDRPTPFTTTSDVGAISSFRCVRKSLQEAFATVADRWGGHLVRDNFDVELRQTIGQNRGVTLQYGKNITDITVTEDWSEVATKILPVGKDGLEIPETFIALNPEDYDIPYSKVVSFEQGSIVQEDFLDELGAPDTVAYAQGLLDDLYRQANAYLAVNHVPKVNYDLKAYLQDVSDVGDTIMVQHPKCRVDLTTQVIALEYNVILERITRVEFGNFKSNLQTLMQDVSASAAVESKKAIVDATANITSELQAATDSIRSVMGNSYVIYDGDKILIVDSLPKESATNCILINNGGIGFSQSGINGTFSSAWAIDGTLNMQNINVINLVADMIKGGTLKLGENMNASGLIEIYAGDNSLSGKIDKDGIILYLKTGEYVKLNATEGLAGYDANNKKIYWADGQEFHMAKSVVEEEITIGNRLRILPITTADNTGVGFVSLVGGGS